MAKSTPRVTAKARAAVKSKPRAKAKSRRVVKRVARKLPSADDIMARFKGKVIPVIKINDANHSVPLVSALLAGGVDIAEITFRTSCAGEAIRRAKTVPGVCVG